MKQATIYHRNGWQLRSWGNGWAYELTDFTAHTFVWFQDDDALSFAGHVMDSDGWLYDNAEDLFADYSDVMSPLN